PRYDKNTLFIIALVLLLGCLAVIQNLIRSKHGRAITSIRDNEIAARATGINVTKYKLSVFTIAAFFAGIAGVLYSASNYTVQSTKFGYNYSIEILVMVVLGGMGNINGSIIAATLVTVLDVKLQTILTGDLAVLQDLLYALVLIVLVIYNNAPALRNFRETHSLKVLWRKIRKTPVDPAHRGDDEAKWDRVPTKIEMNEVLSVELQPQQSTVDPDRKGAK
ncbi:MAG: branched-chain amino acid ABC transporter permease, partial [Firmicutes bacterium]|nr:branched-chain amino acid ABC transporter permease [Bacillota bacterium]